MKYLLLFILQLPVTWGWYASIMHLKHNRDKLRWPAKALGYPWLYAGLVVDVLFNLTWGTLMFLELPRELLYTSRVSRHYAKRSWRGALARWVCRELLDPLDPTGRHCQ